MKLSPEQEQGFTLIEVLAAIVILSIVSLVLTSYFTNAMSYAKTNQNKTIMVNLARNALFYAEKQDFDKWKSYLQAQGNLGFADVCELDGVETPCTYKDLVKDDTVLQGVLHPSINGIEYTINIEYQANLYNEIRNSSDSIKRKTADFLLPVLITVKVAGSSDGHTKQTAVEGYITDEEIR